MRSALIPILFGKPGWVLPGAAIDIDFANSCAWVKGNGLSLPASLLTTTRASTGYAATSSGLLVPFSANIPRITDLGLLVEQAATNVVLWNRDLTNAAWTKSNITAALNQTGADGTANSATSLMATAGNGTCLQAITLASSARFQSAYVKRLTGTGTINMTMDNGATWTAITVTAAYTQLSIPTQTLANPTVGFRIVTSGDAIAVDLVGNETGTFATSPIATTTVAVTRAADSVLLAGMALTAAQVSKAAYTQTSGLNQNASNSNDIMVAFASVGQALRFGGSTIVVADNVANTQASANLGSGTWTGRVKAAFGYDASGYTAIGNDGTRATQAFSWGAITGNVVLGNNAPLSRCINGYLERVAFGSTKGIFDGLTT